MQTTLLIAILFIIIGCNSQVSKEKEKLHTVYYRHFDIFKLAGSDTLKEVAKKGSVEVRYDKELPMYIKYYKSERTVILLFEDSFTIKGNPVYIYSTSNFHGGKSGRHRVYAFHHEEYRDILYVNRSDTLINQVENVPKDSNFSFHLYIKKSNNFIEKISKGEFDYDGENIKLSQSELYSKWFSILGNSYLNKEVKPEILKDIPE
ncbi:MAG TPA: hypothetical protein PKE30_16570 [Niabella sp.]|nr:hypothetical protein [Niabella sp.]